MGVRIINADVLDGLKQLEDESVHCVVTSPPYFGLRDYGVEGQIGLEATPDAYVAKLVEVCREVRRVLRKNGTCWLNLGDSYTPVNYGPNAKNRRESPGSADTLQGKANHWSADIGGLRSHELHKGCRSVGLKTKDLIGIPWRVAFALQADGWWLRQDIIWSKPNPMPESVTDRCTKAHEYLFLLTKAERYFYDAEAIAEAIAESSQERLTQPNIANQNGSDRVPGKTNGSMKAVGTPRNDGARWNENNGRGFYTGGTRNKRSVWEVATSPYPDAHFATFPPALIEPCIKAGCPLRVVNDDGSIGRGTVLDPFGGSGTTGLVADRLGRNAVLIELNPEYAAMAERRIKSDCPMFAEVSP